MKVLAIFFNALTSERLELIKFLLAPQRTAEGEFPPLIMPTIEINALDQNPPTSMSDFRDTPITSSHGGTNSPTQ